MSLSPRSRRHATRPVLLLPAPRPRARAPGSHVELLPCMSLARPAWLSVCQHLPLQRLGAVLLLARRHLVLGSPFSERFSLSEGFSPRLTAGIYRLGVILPFRSMLLPSSLSHALATRMFPWDGPAEGEHVSRLIHITENILLLPVQARTAPHRRHQPNLPVQHLQEVLRAAAASTQPGAELPAKAEPWWLPKRGLEAEIIAISNYSWP